MQLVFRLFWQPGAAMSAILDRGSLLFATVAALASSFILQGAVPWLPLSFFAPLLVLGALYVPATVLTANLLGRLGAFGVVFRRDYSALLTCTLMAFTASRVPAALGAWLLSPLLQTSDFAQAPWARPLLGMAIVAPIQIVYFAFLMFFAVRTVFGFENGLSAAVVGLSWIPLVVAVPLLGALTSILGFLASPFFLLYAWYFLSSEFRGLGDGFRSRQNFHRMMQAAAINPHDGEAQYQLGLIYQQRRQITEAIQRFQTAVAIDPSLTDAHFQLGRIARQQGRLRDALAHFQTVIDQDERHSSSEVLRELGGLYVTARQYADARHELETYVGRRPYDPEGLYYLGQALEGLGETGPARERYTGAIEAVRTAPQYRQRIVARWSRLAQRQLSKLP